MVVGQIGGARCTLLHVHLGTYVYTGMGKRVIAKRARCWKVEDCV